jgi:AAA domain
VNAQDIDREQFEDVPEEDDSPLTPPAWMNEGPEPTARDGIEPSSGWAPPDVTSYGASFDPARIPLRRWLLGSRRSVGEVTIDAGPPGVNKSTLMLTDAVAITTGRQILADKVHETGAAMYLAGEDARRDVEARLAGILELYRINPAELADRLHVVYLAEIDPIPYTLAQMAEDMAMLNQRMLGWLRDFPDILAIFVDPLMAWHRLMENSNEAIQLLSTSLRAIAVQGKRHVGIDHHVTKITMADPEGHVGNLASVRGAGSLVGYTRWAFTLARLNAETATALGIPDKQRSRFRRLDSLKTSYGADDERMRLLRVESVTIANGESVGVLVEQDLETLHAEGKERTASIKETAQRRLTEALTRMLTESRPRSANAAALWLITHAPELVTGKKGETLSEFSVRRRLPAMIGTGLSTRFDDRHTRIVIRPAAKNGRGSEIDFETTPETITCA